MQAALSISLFPGIPNFEYTKNMIYPKLVFCARIGDPDFRDVADPAIAGGPKKGDSASADAARPEFRGSRAFRTQTPSRCADFRSTLPNEGAIMQGALSRMRDFPAFRILIY